ncbi:MAG: hypothetical protein LUH54_00085, partial [Firmicutes bacterium]|nr:hypothetical protein [Bacillota bacterium]
IRCGVCGRAVVRGGHIDSVCDITSITLRVPHDIPGCAAGVCRLFFSELKASSGLLIYSPPGVGKTTLLRDFILSASDKYNVAVVDSRGELFLDWVSGNIDYLRGYPKHTAIIHAVRSLCPDLIVCDELFGEDDAAAAIYAYSCGVPLVASAHAGCTAELYARNDIAHLYSSHAFGCVVGISRGTYGNAFALETEFCKNER